MGGLLAGLGKFASKWILPSLPSIIGGAASLKGGKDRNAAANAQALRQMEFQERMSSTAHQREVKDLRAAGLNPVLSGTGGAGSSSPGGAQASVQDVLTPAVNTALSARRLSQEINNLKAQQKLTEKQTEVLGGPAVLGEGLGRVGGQVNDLVDALRSPEGALWLEETWKDITAIFNRTGHNSAEAIRQFLRRFNPMSGGGVKKPRLTLRNLEVSPPGGR